MNEHYRKIYARLVTMAALNEAAIKANPIPYLEKAAARIIELEQAASEAAVMLTGADDMMLRVDAGVSMDYRGPVELCKSRNDKAYARLRKVMSR